MQSKIDVSIECTIEGTAINTNCMKGNAECNIVCLSARLCSGFLVRPTFFLILLWMFVFVTSKMHFADPLDLSGTSSTQT